MDPLVLFISFFGGGVTSALMVQLFSLRAARRQQQIKLLEEQIRELYAPLFYLVAQCERLLEVNKQVHGAYKFEFIDKKYSDNELTQERLRSSTDATIRHANAYVELVEPITEKIRGLLEDKFAYIDPDDVEVCLLFFEHRTRLSLERDEGGAKRMPMEIHDHLGDISYLKPEFVERVKSKFFSKKSKLEKLSKR